MYGPTCHGGRHAVGGSSGRMDSSPTCSCAPLNTTRGACWYVGTRRVGVHVLLVLYAEDGGPHRRSATASAIDASPVCMYGRPVELLSVGQRHLASTSSHPHAACMRAPTRSSTCHLLAWSLGRRHQQCLERARLLAGRLEIHVCRLLLPFSRLALPLGGRKGSLLVTSSIGSILAPKYHRNIS